VTARRGLLRSLLVSALAAAPALAQDAFEIQVYDAATAGPLEPGLEVHLNHFIQGPPPRARAARSRPTT
jgi:hypothetical protein